METPLRPVHVALGVFDGVHRGHQALLQQAIQNARRWQQASAVCTFFPHPQQILQSSCAPSLIYPLPQRRWLLHRFGCERVWVQPFNAALASQTPGEFLKELQRIFPSLTALYVGEDFHFGAHRCGDTATLRALCEAHHCSLVVCPTLYEAGEKISSTRIRQALRQQPIAVANSLLGQPYHCIGMDRGSFFSICYECLVKDGVYACRLQNRRGSQSLRVQVSQGRIQFLKTRETVRLPGACRLMFEHDC